MTNASVKPALIRIEKKLDEMKEMIEPNNNSTENENGSEKSIEVCDFTEKMASEEEKTK